LDSVFIAVQNDSDQEDDVILLGDLNVDNQHLGELGRLLDITWVVTGRTPTNTLGTKQYDNIVFNRRATTEYTGRGGVMDLMSVYGMTRQQAKSVSDHLPVWAEFRIYEDGAGQRVAFGRRPAVR
jgi:endonuclease/exonuclease/phosphatase family metal-dependent hydrolase